MTAVRLARGMMFAGDYRILSSIGHGGLGTVYEAEQVSTHRVRALKVLHPQFVEDESIRARFEQEARVAAKIPSPNVVQVFATGVDEASGSPWMAMELLRGEDLEAAIARRGRLPPGEVLSIFGQLCHALGQAHRLGIVHRDLKPENVFLATSPSAGEAPTVKVLDFGIAKWIDDQRSSQENSQLIGTPLWMAPEQAQRSAAIRPATDVWALGLIAFRLLTGRLYWKSAGPPPLVAALLSELINDPIESASGRAAFYGCRSLIPAGFDEWFARCVVRDATQRFPDAAKALTALEPVLVHDVKPDDAAVAAFAHTVLGDKPAPRDPASIGEESTMVGPARPISPASRAALGEAATMVGAAPVRIPTERPGSARPAPLTATVPLGAPPRSPFGPPKPPSAPAGKLSAAPQVSSPQAATLPPPSQLASPQAATLPPPLAMNGVLAPLPGPIVPHAPPATPPSKGNARLAVGLVALLSVLGLLGYLLHH